MSAAPVSLAFSGEVLHCTNLANLVIAPDELALHALAARHGLGFAADIPISVLLAQEHEHITSNPEVQSPHDLVVRLHPGSPLTDETLRAGTDRALAIEAHHQQLARRTPVENIGFTLLSGGFGPAVVSLFADRPVAATVSLAVCAAGVSGMLAANWRSRPEGVHLDEFDPPFVVDQAISQAVAAEQPSPLAHAS